MNLLFKSFCLSCVNAVLKKLNPTLDLLIHTLLTLILTSPFQDSTSKNNQHMLLVFAACHLAAMSSVYSNPVLYGLLNWNYQKVILTEKISFHMIFEFSWTTLNNISPWSLISFFCCRVWGSSSASRKHLLMILRKYFQEKLENMCETPKKSVFNMILNLNNKCFLQFS